MPPIEDGDLAIIERGFHKWLDDRKLVTEEHCKGSHINTKLKIQEVEKDMTELTKDLKAIPDKIDSSQRKAKSDMRITLGFFTFVLGIIMIALRIMG